MVSGNVRGLVGRGGRRRRWWLVGVLVGGDNGDWSGTGWCIEFL
jgi:hypothetical protein